MKTVSFAATHVGLRRSNNEDRYLANDGAGLYAVADGIGGHAGGEVAAQMTVDVLRHEVVAGQRIGNALAVAHNKICDHMLSDSRLWGMGTTCTALHTRDAAGQWLHVDVAHVGDSAAFVFDRRHVPRKLTTDHGSGNVIYNCLGSRRNKFAGAETTWVTVGFGAVLVLATDGLTRYLAPDLAELPRLVFGGPLEGAVDRLVQFALDSGGRDNVTVVVVAVLP